MIKIYKGGEIEAALTGAGSVPAGIEAAVGGILARVKEQGDAALFEYAEKFDSARLDALEVTKEEIDEAYGAIDPYFIKTLEDAGANIAAFHEKQKQNGFLISEKNGVVLGQRIIPLERVGIYVPGGTASYPSSVLMNAVPAKIAGVLEIVMATPPGKNGKIDKNILAAAKIAGVDRVFKMGGAQAVAALTFGTESVPKTDKIVGPGNIYVATAKRMVFGVVDIDMIAGPSDILVLADDTCRADWIAADLLSQAEHDKLASAVLVTDSERLAAEVAAEVEKQLSRLSREETARESLDKNGKIILVRDMAEGVKIVNRIAPEHLEICTDEPFAILGGVKNAGSVFLGKNAPEALGDYFAGPNHTLPTGGTARFSSPLGVDDFVKRSSFSYYTKEALAAVYKRVADFARREGLEAHAKSVEIRFEKD